VEVFLKSVNFLGKRVPVPGHPVLRVLLGIAFLIGGFLGFLPVLGFWMVPLGLLILSIDFPPVRRFRRAATVRIIDWLAVRWPRLAQKMGAGSRRAARKTAAYR
jgi:purine-cytosine permease-like protein